MFSNDFQPSVYHPVPRFDIAAKGGALELGTVVDDLVNLRPLNRKHMIHIPEDQRYPPVCQSGFVETRSRLREGHGGIWAKLLVLQGVGASIEGSANNDTNSTVACDALITAYFDPDPSYIERCLSVDPVSQHFITSRYKESVYLVTGLKVARNLRYSEGISAARTGDVMVGIQEPTTGIQVGVDTSISTKDGYSVKFQVTDIIVGIRASRYKYVSSCWNPYDSHRRLAPCNNSSPNLNIHFELEGKDEIKTPKVTYERVPIEEERDAQKDAQTSGELDELWVVPAGVNG